MNILMMNTKEQRELYDSIGIVYCKHLDVDVIFNAKGFHHLFYNGTGRARSSKEVNYRLKLIPLIIPVIKNAKEFSKRKRNGRYSRGKDVGIKDVEYWSLEELVGKSGNVPIRVILRKVGNGAIHFWSVMRLRKIKSKQKTPT